MRVFVCLFVCVIACFLVCLFVCLLTLSLEGLRGAIAFALAAEYSEGDARRIILTTTLVIVLATVLINGSSTTAVLELLRIRCDKPYLFVLYSSRLK